MIKHSTRYKDATLFSWQQSRPLCFYLSSQCAEKPPLTAAGNQRTNELPVSNQKVFCFFSRLFIPNIVTGFSQ